MRALNDALTSGAYPAGLFWCVRAEDALLEAPRALIDRATNLGIQAEFIQVETFDEFMSDLANMMPDSGVIPQRDTRLTVATVPPRGSSWPVVRLNAVPVVSYPTVARRLVCTIGGTGDVLGAIRESQAAVVATRRKQGVVAFGSDAEVRRAFDGYDITEFDLYSIEPRRLRYESAEMGLLYDAFAVALSKHRPLAIQRRRSGLAATINPELQARSEFDPLRNVVKELSGRIKGTEATWTEGVYLRFELHFNRLWLVFDPTVRLNERPSIADEEAAKEFIRERLAQRYNATWNALVDAWASLISSDELEMRAFNCTTGVDAAFQVGRVTAFSRRG
jgi:hypothetical protein